MIPSDGSIVLHRAYRFDCPRCGRRTYGDMIEAELPPDRAEAIARAVHGIEPWQDLPEGAGAEVVAAPERVTCESCGTEYAVFPDDPPID